MVSSAVGEWWNSDIEAVEAEAMHGGGPKVSDAYTINGFPGPLYPSCSQDIFVQAVEPGKTYLLRLINAALNDELFFSISGHRLTVVEADAAYTKPFITPAVMLAPGQTMSVLLTTLPFPPSSPFFPLAVRPYVTATAAPFDNSTALGFLHYSSSESSAKNPPLVVPQNLPPLRSSFAAAFSDLIRSLATGEFPCKVPKNVDRVVFLAISLNLQDCCKSCVCDGFNGKRFAASVNNQSFIRPLVSILQSYYNHSASAELSFDFPVKPVHPFNYTAEPAANVNLNAEYGGRLLRLAFGERVEFVLQDTAFLNTENHPIHVHGHNFFVVGSGVGNYDEERDRAKYNLEDPPERNTVAVPSGGWAAIRFTADNPGVWFVHCHLEVHTTWGLAMGIVVEEGQAPEQRILPPPADLPVC
ncbi:hypothetical protein HPP92_023860 [Vanilla planifolia]|uniref:laccase n=1 Tax=Vanilla planifolia TaxID=51239 RepID=A0A835UAX0_VANPL|nr:hypothetical protein HPP92_023860 [Vanilla planifolia]